MDRRAPRAKYALALTVVAAALVASQANLGATPAGAAIGGPHSSMAGPTTFAAIGPTAIPANGSTWYVTGAPHASWDDDDLHDLQQLHGSDFEAVDTTDLR